MTSRQKLWTAAALMWILALGVSIWKHDWGMVVIAPVVVVLCVVQAREG